jgi:hypothetical protein
MSEKQKNKEENSRLWNRRDVLKMAAAGIPAILSANSIAQAKTFDNVFGQITYRAEMREIPNSQKFLIANKKDGSPDPKGWYHHSLGIVDTPEGLVCTYRQTDSHTAVISNIMTCRSNDKGQTWIDHKMISKSDVWNEGGCWVAPQLSRLRDERIVLIADFGKRTTGQNWPMLSDWQKPPRGMSNHLFWSADNGKTWSGPHRIDELGGEPGYIIELSNGTLIYTRTESSTTDSVWNPPQPWGKNYYQNVAVFSDDQGKTWNRTSMISDEPHQGDCEVGLVELAPNNLMAMTRIGLAGGGFMQPSRFIYSRDNGKTWGEQTLSPIYGQRTIVRKLQSGKLFATYRNSWGTPGSYCVIWDIDEKLPYQPSSFIWDESRTILKNGAMTIASEEGREKGAIFALYPAQAPDTRVEIDVELRVEKAELNGCSISAGCYVRFLPNRIELADRPTDGFAVDATKFHKYRILREKGEIMIFVDGELKLRKPTENLETRFVHFGNRFVPGWTGNLEAPKGLLNEPSKPRQPLLNASLSEWKSMRVRVENKKDHSIDWKWNVSEGFPDQFRRSRIVRLDRNASFSAGHSGYSSWTQMKDGTIVIADYTVGSVPAPVPFARAYVTTEKELLG